MDSAPPSARAHMASVAHLAAAQGSPMPAAALHLPQDAPPFGALWLKHSALWHWAFSAQEAFDGRLPLAVAHGPRGSSSAAHPEDWTDWAHAWSRSAVRLVPVRESRALHAFSQRPRRRVTSALGRGGPSQTPKTASA
jgi:hypothetical protein